MNTWIETAANFYIAWSHILSARSGSWLSFHRTEGQRTVSPHRQHVHELRISPVHWFDSRYFFGGTGNNGEINNLLVLGGDCQPFEELSPAIDGLCQLKNLKCLSHEETLFLNRAGKTWTWSWFSSSFCLAHLYLSLHPRAHVHVCGCAFKGTFYLTEEIRI